MSVILRWGLGVGLAIGIVDFLTVELSRGLSDVDVIAAVQWLNMLASLALFGWAAYRVARSFAEVRPGLEAAVLAGVLAGILAFSHASVGGAESPTLTLAVQAVALNVVLAAIGGTLGAYSGSTRRTQPPGADLGR